MPMIDEKDYQRAFEGEKKKLALAQALDIRKFEIEMYWKRATYFWTLIAATLVGYTTLQTSSLANESDYLVILAALGTLFSVAWSCVNRGSKQWQENWENHVDMLEDEVMGPLYKTVLRRRDPAGVREWTMNFFTGPMRISASGVNQIISLYAVILWIALLWKALPPFDRTQPVNWFYVLIVGGLILACIGFFTVGQTHTGDHGHKANRRESVIVDSGQ